MGADHRLQQPGDARPRRAGQRGEDDREHDVQQLGHVGERRADPHGDVGADEVLALAADVEQPAAEGEGDREPGEDQRGGEDQRLLQVQRRGRALVAGDPREDPVQPGAVEDRLVGRDRVVAGEEDHQAGDEEGEHRREDRHDDAAALHVGRQPRRRGGRRGLGAALARQRLAGLRLLAHAAASALRPPPVMAMPSSSSEAVGRELAHDLALVDDEDAVGQRAHLLELQRDEQDAAARVALGDQAAVDELDRADVQAARGLRGDEHARVARDLARDDALLLVAARQRRGQRCRAAAAHVVLLDEAGGAVAHAVDQQPAVPRQLGRVVLAQREVLRQGEVQDEAAALAVLGDVRDAVADHAARAGVGQLVAADDDRARVDRPQAGDRLDELALAVAVDAGQGHDLARTDGQRGAV